jgi:hypothetical protein
MAIKGKAKYYSGAVRSSKRIVLEDAFVQNDEVVIEIAQPAGTIIDNIYVRFIGNVNLATSGILGWELGTTSSAADVCTNAGGFMDNGTDVPAGSLFRLNHSFAASGAGGYQGWSDGDGNLANTKNDQASPAADNAYSEQARKLFFTTQCTDDVVTGDNKIEINVMFINLS